MRFYSFEKENYQTQSDNTDTNIIIYDLFERTITDNDNIKDSFYFVEYDLSCRLDLVSDKIYDSIDYCEEIMAMNNILNPYSIEKDDTIRYSSNPNALSNLYINDNKELSTNKYKILNINKNKTSSNIGLPPSVNPGLKQIDVDYDKKRITVINKFK